MASRVNTHLHQSWSMGAKQGDPTNPTREIGSLIYLPLAQHLMSPSECGRDMPIMHSPTGDSSPAYRIQNSRWQGGMD